MKKNSRKFKKIVKIQEKIVKIQEKFKKIVKIQEIQDFLNFPLKRRFSYKWKIQEISFLEFWKIQEMKFLEFSFKEAI